LLSWLDKRSSGKPQTSAEKQRKKKKPRQVTAAFELNRKLGRFHAKDRKFQSNCSPSQLLLPRHDHPLQPRLSIIAARAGVKDGDAKARVGVTVRAAQPELQIVDEEIRPQPIEPPVTYTQQSRRFL
jgi:hypothetical protein